MERTRNLVFTALLTALIVAGAYIRIPVGPVPIVLANLFVILAGLLLPLKWAVSSVALYLLLGFVGLPVFAQGSGIAYFGGPTGGYLIGYLPAVVLTSLIASKHKLIIWREVVAAIVGMIIIYVVGVPWLRMALEMSWSEAFVAGMIPFLPGDGAKVVLAVLVTVSIRKMYPELLPPTEPTENSTT